MHLLRFIAGSLCSLLATVTTAQPESASRASTPDGVLILHSNQRPTPAAIITEDTLRKVVPDAVGRPVELFSEYLDGERSSIEHYGDAIAEFMRIKYRSRNIRVIVAIAPPATSFAAAFRAHILPGVPVVHIASPVDQQHQSALPTDFVGHAVDLDPTPTVTLALRLLPQTKRVVFVVGAAERDHVWERRLRAAAQGFRDRVAVEYLSGLGTAELLQRLTSLPSDTIVFTPGYFVDGAGRIATPRHSVEQMAAASSVPVFGALDTFLGSGIVGGYAAAYDEQAKHGGALVAQLLNGTTPSQVATKPVPSVPFVDWRQIRRWGIDERLLPVNTVIRFRQPTVWDQYWREISLAVVVLLLQTALIAGLLLQRSRRRAAEHAAQALRSEVAHASRLAIAGELTASIAHEINQPLGAILSNAEAADLMLQSGEDRRDVLRQILADIRRDDLRASEVIRRLRGLLAKHEVEQKPFDLNEAIAEALQMLQAETRNRRLTIDLRPAPAASVIGDRIQIQQVIINLLLNAMDAVAGEADDRRTIVLTVSNSNGRVVLSVRDRGHGISAQELPKLFKSFFSTKRLGMGMGLSVARTIVDAHGGSIWAEDCSGGGALFCVELPAAGGIAPGRAATENAP